MSIFWLLALLQLTIGNEAKSVVKRGVMDNFNDGLKIAGQMFGINTAADVANLVARAFSGTASQRKPNFMSFLQQQAGFDNQSGDSEAAAAATTYQQEQENAQESPPHQSEEQTAKPPPASGPNIDFNTGQMLTNMLRMIGFDATKLGALAINALVMIAQAIGNTLMSATRRLNPQPIGNNQHIPTVASSADTGPESLYAPNDHEPRSLRTGTPIDWFLEKPNGQMRALLKEVTDEQLAERVVQMIEQLETQADHGGCLKLLMCKSSPFIWGMQKSVRKRLNLQQHINNTKARENTHADDENIDDAEDDDDQHEGNNSFFNKQVLFKYLPSIDEFRAHGETCESRFAQFCKREKIDENYLKKV